MDFFDDDNMIEELLDEEFDSKESVVPEKQLKLWHGIALLVFVAADIVVLGNLVSMLLGIRGFYGTAIGEVLMAFGSIVIVLIAGVKLKPVFQFRKPTWRKTWGTIFIWIGSFLLTMMIATIMEYFFPTEMAGVSQGLEEGILSVEMLPALLIVSLSPAICEEMVFRGVLFNCVWNKTHRKWMTIIVTGVIFGVFHGSVWRFVPTCILGIMMGYILFETNNMFYNMLYHGINNGVPVLLMFAANFTAESIGAQIDSIANDPDAYRMMILPGIGLYVLLGALGVWVLYIGRNMIKYVDLTVPKEARFAKRRKERMVVVTLCCALIALGVVILCIGFAMGTPMVETTIFVMQ